MTTTITYPNSLDSNDNLYEVHDGLRVRLIEDYNPGDKIIYVLGDELTMQRFNATGIITLTEQCSDPSLRAISFYYGSKTNSTFEDIVLLEGFTDSIKPKNITNVTQNVMSHHHNSLKDSIIAIEQFVGKKGELPHQALEGTMEQRITYLRKLALPPKAWFRANKNVGLAPFTVEFEDRSFRLGTDGTSTETKLVWDFGDNSGPSIIEIEEDEEVSSETVNVLVSDTDGGKIKKTYTVPGIYNVSLTVTNDFGSDTVTFEDFITARFPAPDSAVINFIQRAGQIVTDSDPPKIRSSINSIIDVNINTGINSLTGKTYSGESVDETDTPIDPIVNYTWDFSDDHEHSNSSSSRAVFSIGGLYDLNLRVDTKFGAYRITNYVDSFDVVEKYNLWLWTHNDNGTVSSSEFGLISETFKVSSNVNLDLNVDESFLDGHVNEDQLKREFKRNNGFAQRGTVSSGNSGVGILYWASGRSTSDSASTELIKMAEFNGFTNTYSTKPNHYRPWNWIGLPSLDTLYFILGGITGSIIPNTSPTNKTRDALDLNDLSYDASPTVLTMSDFKNGANELTSNEVIFDVSGNPNQGHMSVYRSTWHESSGFILRNEGVGDFFRIKSFYKTGGDSTDMLQTIRKLPDMSGSARVEGQLVSMSQGVYFFSNSGTVAAYNTNSSVWATGGPGANSTSFKLLQDTSQSGFDDSDQTLLAASDGDKVTYLSFDYSEKTFFKFNEIDTTFSSVTTRPIAEQWQMCIF